MGGRGRTEAIASLRAEREELDSRIRFFESQLRVGATAPATVPPSLSAKLDAMGLHGGAAAGGLSPDMVRRYSSHLLLPDFGVEGCLGIVDGDDVQLHDLHRQTMYIEAYVGQPKAKSAAATCRVINSLCQGVRVSSQTEAKKCFRYCETI